ncbi:hypothetical protein [Shouchella clausii]|uniref:Uncharacterized protein n=1 Tax=Shouchella clausii TaxID=79880 RepID=A0A268P5A3_SHOCL|nr:hypothetical protein [Shouchella clausii]PAE90927.1 hypothetical protein CHH72_00470 [Shouchella clausii]
MKIAYVDAGYNTNDRMYVYIDEMVLKPVYKLTKDRAKATPLNEVQQQEAFKLDNDIQFED